MKQIKILTIFVLLFCIFPYGIYAQTAKVLPYNQEYKRDKKAIVKYLSELPNNASGKVISGQFEKWGSEVKPFNDKENYLNIIRQKTGRWVGLVGAEYHDGQGVNYEKPNKLFEEYWDNGGFCQLYLIMTNPTGPTFNGGGKCDIKTVLDSNNINHTHFYNELDKVATGLKELQNKGVVVFLNPFAEANANWFWWGGGNPTDFIALYRAVYNYLVTNKGLDNLIFIYEPTTYYPTALQYYPGDKYVDMIGFSLFVDYNKELDSSDIPNYQELKKLGKPLCISQWGPRRGKDQTNVADQPPADNLKLIRGIQKYFPDIVWWMNWNYAYSICTDSDSNYNGTELLNHTWVINRDDIKLYSGSLTQSVRGDTTPIVTVGVADSDYIFLAPESIKITVNIENKNQKSMAGNLVVTLTSDNHKPVKTDSTTIEIAGKTTYSEIFGLDNPMPGFYRYTVQFKQDSTVIYEKKINIGYEPEKISSPIDAKEDFKAFWDNSLKELAKIKPDYKLTLVPEYSKADYDIYLVEMRSLDNELIRGYYSKPKREGKYPVIVDYMGYGADPYPPTQWWDGFAHFILSVRGQALNLSENRFGNWITYGLDSKENYYYRGAYMDAVRALDFVCNRPEIDEEKIAVRGGSQGGTLSFVAAALDKRVKVAAPSNPGFSDYHNWFHIVPWPKSEFENYTRQKCENYIREKIESREMTSEEAQQYVNAQIEAVYDILSYFDIKNLAQWIKCPLIMGIGMQDEICPPRINFAAYNQVKSEKRWMACPDCGHSVNNAYYDESLKFIKEKLGIQK